MILFLNNDIAPKGWFTPGNITGCVDIYGHDDYPMGFNCKVPSTWTVSSLLSNFRALHDLETRLLHSLSSKIKAVHSALGEARDVVIVQHGLTRKLNGSVTRMTSALELLS